MQLGRLRYSHNGKERMADGDDVYNFMYRKDSYYIRPESLNQLTPNSYAVGAGMREHDSIMYQQTSGIPTPTYTSSLGGSKPNYIQYVPDSNFVRPSFILAGQHAPQVVDTWNSNMPTRNKFRTTQQLGLGQRRKKPVMVKVAKSVKIGKRVRKM